MSDIKSMKDLPEWASEKYTKTLSACKDDATAIVYDSCVTAQRNRAVEMKK